MLYKKDDDGNALIDLVLVILEGGSRDLGTSYELINQVIIPALGDSAKDRILVAINQCDMAMKGRYFDYEENKPEPKLVEFLEDKVRSVKARIKEATGVDIEPIYYSAGFKEEGMPQQRPYNLSKLLYFIVKHTPEEKRVHIAQNMSKEKEMWKDNDDVVNYNEKIKESFFGSMVKSVSKGASVGADIGGSIGGIFGSTGRAIGSAIGGAIGAVGGFLGSLFGW